MSYAQEKPARMRTLQPKLSVIGQDDHEIAGGIGHDCDDLLTVILGHAELLAMGNLSLETRADYIERIESATKKIRDRMDRAGHPQVARD